MNSQSKMLAIQVIVAMLIVALPKTVLSALPKSDGLTKRFSGTIVRISGAEIKIIDPTGDKSKFSLSDDAKVYLNGRESSLSEINAGLRCTITATSHDGRWIATTIRAKRRLRSRRDRPTT